MLHADNLPCPLTATCSLAHIGYQTTHVQLFEDLYCEVDPLHTAVVPAHFHMYMATPVYVLHGRILGG